MAIEIFDVSITLSRDNSNDDDETWEIQNLIKDYKDEILSN